MCLVITSRTANGVAHKPDHVVVSVMHRTLLYFMLSARSVAFWKKLHPSERRGWSQGPVLALKELSSSFRVVFSEQTHPIGVWGFLQMRHSSPSLGTTKPWH